MARVKCDAGNAGSPEAAPGAAPWSEEDMRRAQPLPLPLPSPDASPPAPAETGTTHAGRGEVEPGGPPEP